MVGIPWSNLKDTLTLQGHMPLLGWPSGIDPMDCMFVQSKGKLLAVYKQVYIAEWSDRDPEWMDIR